MQSSSADAHRPYAVIIGLDSIQGIQAARILARRHIPVIAIAEDPTHHACQTRVCQQILFTGSRNEGLIHTLEDLGPKLGPKAVLFPCTDLHVLLVSRNRRRLQQRYHVVLPEPETVELLVDKARFYAFAQQEGLPISPTFFLRSRADAIQLAKHLPYPSILKPSTRSVEWVRHTKLKAFNVANAEHLLALYDHYHAWADVLIAQEWIEGSETSHYTCNVYFDSNSEPLVTFVSRKLRQWPPETGQGSLAEECRNDIVLNETVRLFRRVNYTGLGYLEMKRDERSGRYFIIEPNIGRPTGRSALAEASGVELLYTMYCDAVGLPLPSNRTQRYQGMKWIHLRRDIQSALYYWRRGDLTLREWWLSWRGPKTDALFSWSDPAPFLADLFGAARVYLSPVERNKRNYRRPAA